jgi:hypothetical protein
LVFWQIMARQYGHRPNRVLVPPACIVVVVPAKVSDQRIKGGSGEVAEVFRVIDTSSNRLQLVCP